MSAVTARAKGILPESSTERTQLGGDEAHTPSGFVPPFVVSMAWSGTGVAIAKLKREKVTAFLEFSIAVSLPPRRGPSPSAATRARPFALQ